MAATITVRGLTKRHGTVTAVSDLDLDIAAGEFVTVLGPSGCGKTTTLMCIAGFTLPDAGEILVNGRSVVGLPAHKRQLGVVFQHASLFPHMTVFENVAFSLRMRDRPRVEVEERVRDALAMVRLSGFERRRPSQLSGGQQQRVALARALVFRPPVLLLDEPLAALDLKLRQQLQAEIKRLHEELGVTVVSVTHDQSEALAIADRIVVMKDGRIQQTGTPEELYRYPVNAFVTQFIGEANLLKARVIRREGACVVAWVENELEVRGIMPHDHSDPRDEVTLVLRPESIVVGEACAGLANAFAGVVEKTVYLGQATRYHVRVGNAVSLVAEWQNRSGMARAARDERVVVGWAAEDMVVL
ncbi:MAG TPA: ABC transporter ATP-binding protein [Candidatus Methylomirabilis sp.]|nr:ABC transporter ATP-binding protein [Candidatus Methylomirabilis sp.]